MSRLNAPVVVAAFVLGCVVALGMALADRSVQVTATAPPPTHPVGFAPVDNVPTIAPGVRTTTTAARRRGYVGASGTWKGLACGGALPPCSVLRCENPAGDLRAQNPTSSASGKWQVIRSTWAGYGGYPEAWNAPEGVQDAHAAALWDGGRGASHWRSCL